jgi:hypothetical protein
MLHETFSTQLLDDRTTQWIEPAWKLILSSKGILPILWELNPSDPNLLEAYFEPGRLSRYAKKPLFSREGSNVTLYDEKGAFAEVGGDHGEEGSSTRPSLPSRSSTARRRSWVAGWSASNPSASESASPPVPSRQTEAASCRIGWSNPHLRSETESNKHPRYRK